MNRHDVQVLFDGLASDSVKKIRLLAVNCAFGSLYLRGASRGLSLKKRQNSNCLETMSDSIKSVL